MTRTQLNTAIAAVLFATVAMVGCKKKEETAVTPAPTPTETAPAPAPMPEPAPAPTAPTTSPAAAAVTSVDLGSAVDATNKVSTAATTFKPTDTIYASVTTSAATATPAKITAKWTFQDGQVVAENSEDVKLEGAGATSFKINKQDGLPEGNYKVEVSVDGNVVQTKEFSVKK